MQYTKPMIDLVLQIRKNSPSHLKASIKLADPNLLQTLAQQYQHLEDAELRKSVAQLMALAGPAWSELLVNSVAPQALSHPVPASPGSKLMYRGQRVTR